MLNIGYKTKSNDTPNGKPRVWFCAHKSDYKYFKSVCSDLFEYTNCALYYDLNAENSSLNDDLSLLSDMNLFVMPVTSNLLYTQNRAIDKELAFALQRDIPVLPIVYEKGLNEQFYKKCGNLQYLDKTVQDDSAITYEEKLKKHLSKILLGNDIYQKVRKAFDAYIFLSYRKKDRVKAKELMSLIHANEFCRDIAIWYDEFLTPGEDFNRSIKSALKKSELFVLTVTPNLVNEENYVMKVEYPQAVKRGKKILSARMEDVNEQELKDKYLEIPNSFDAKNINLLSEMLKDSLQGVALLANDGDPVHNYFIGLAYLYGIDVEVNNEMAVKLIKKSAEGGLSIAFEKLSDMYYNGEGVERNLYTAISYKTQSVKNYYQEFYDQLTEVNLEKFIQEINELADYYEVANDYKKVKQIYESLIEVLNNLGCEDALFITRLITNANFNYGKALRKLNDESCVKVLERVVKQFEKIVAKTNKVSDKRALSLAYNALSVACVLSFNKDDNSWDEYGNKNWNRLNGREFESLELAKKSLKIDKEIAKETDLAKDKRSIYYAYNRISQAYLNLQYDKKEGENALKLSKEYSQKAIDYALTFKGDADSESKKILAYAYDKMAFKRNVLAKNNKDNSECQVAEEYYLKAIKLKKERCKKIPTISNLQDLSSSYSGIISNATDQKDYKKALKYSKINLQLQEEIYKSASFDNSRSDLAQAYHEHAEILVNLKNEQGAKEFFKKSDYLTTENIQKIVDTAEQAEKLYLYYSQKIADSLSVKDYNGITANFNKAFQALKALIKSSKQSKIYYAMVLAISSQQIASAFLNRDFGDDEFHAERFSPAIDCYQKGIEILSFNLKKEQTQDVALAQFHIAKNYELLGEAYHYAGDSQNAINSFNSAIYYREISYKNWSSVCKDEYKNAYMEFELVKTLIQCSWAFSPEEGKKAYYRASEILSRLVKNFPNEKAFANKFSEVCEYINRYYS